MAFNIGVNVVEVDGRAAPAIVAAPVSVAGFLVVSERGVPNLAVPMRGVADFRNNFGGVTATALGAHAVRGFFDNGGTQAFVVRAVGSGARPARVVLNDRAAAPLPTLELVAGMRGRPDPGAWGNALSVIVVDHPRGGSTIPAQVVGSTAEPFALADGQSMAVAVNGATPVTLTFAATAFSNIASASAGEVAAAINRQTTVLRAAVTPDRRLLLASALTGPASRVAVTADAVATALGFSGGTLNSDGALAATATLAALQSVGGFLPGSAVQLETRGHVIGTAALPASITIPANGAIVVTADANPGVTVGFVPADFVGGLAAATPGEVAAAINRQAHGLFTAALTHDQRLVLLSNSFGPASAIIVAAGPADARAALLLTTAAPVAGRREYQVLAAVSEADRVVAWGTALAAALPVLAARIQSVEFDLVVQRAGEEVERFESLSMQTGLDYYVAAVVNDQDRGSRFVMAIDRNNASAPGLDVPAERRDPGGRLLASRLGDPAVSANVGVEAAPADTDFIGDPARRTGLRAFDLVRIQLLACPDTGSAAVALAALAYCESRGDAMFVGTTPRGYDLDAAKTYAATLRGRKVYGALYWPWIQTANPLDTTGNVPRIWVPPVGHVLGAYARIAEGRGVWKAPAGDEALIRNALAVERDITDVEHTDLVKNGGVNAIRAIPGSGIIIDSSRTLSTDTRWLFVDVRRLFNFVKVSLRDGLRWVAQEPHSDELRRAVKFNVIVPFLLGLWRQGAFGSDAPEEVFTVICDATNNPPAEVNLGNFKVEVYFYPVKPAETIVIIVGQQESGATAAET